MAYSFARETKYPETPKGKRSIKGNIYGNLNGYVGGKRFWEFGDRWSAPNIRMAELWVNGASLQEAWEQS